MALVKFFMGRALAGAGEESRALALLTSARDELLEVGDQRMAARVMIGLGVIHARQGSLADARSELEQAVAEFAHSGARHYEAEAREELAAVLQKAGDENSAREQQTRATELRSASGSTDTSKG
jgi:Tfp pilus assembly protein PilF